LGDHTDAGAKREEIEEEMLHRDPHSFRAGRVIRHRKALKTTRIAGQEQEAVRRNCRGQGLVKGDDFP
jgi:hypothetical protein